MFDKVELYVATPQFKLYFSTRFGGLEDVKDGIKMLLAIRNDIERIGHEVKKDHRQKKKEQVS